MPATYTEYNKQDTWDEAKLIAEFRLNMETALGFTFVEQTVSGTTTHVVWSRVVNAAAVRSTVFIRLTLVNAGATRVDMFASIGFGYTAGGTWLGLHPLPSLDFTGIKGQLRNLFWYTIDHGEWRTVGMRFTDQADRYIHLGYARPGTKPAYWNEDQFLYAFLPANHGRNFITAAANPYTNAADTHCIAATPSFYSETAAAERFVGSNTQGRKTVLFPLPIVGANDLYGTFGNDFGILSNAANEFPPFSRFQPAGTEEWVTVGHYRNVNVIRIS